MPWRVREGEPFSPLRLIRLAAGLVQGTAIHAMRVDDTHARPVHLLMVVRVAFRVAPDPADMVDHERRIQTVGKAETERVRIQVAHTPHGAAERRRIVEP